MKKIIAILFAVVSFSVVADTWRDPNTGIIWTYTISNGEASVGGGSDSSPAVPTTTTGAITIPSTLGGYPVTCIGYYAFRDCTSLTSVTIPDGVTSIGDCAFSYCSGLTSVTIPSSVTSIGGSAFWRCSGLKEVHIRDIASWCKISFGDNPLVNEAKLYVDNQEVSELVIPEEVMSIGDYAFICCSGLTSITIPDSVTSIGGSAFSGCSGLTSVTIPSSVTSIGNYAFEYCSGLTSVTIPSSVLSIGSSAFYNCSGLKEVHINDIAAWCKMSFDNLDANPLYYAHKIYLDDKEITDLVIPEGVTSIGNYAFHGCSGLTSITIPSSVTSIGNYAFHGCSGLTSITIPSSVTSIGGGAFYGCNKLATVFVDIGDVSRVQSLMVRAGLDNFLVVFGIIKFVEMVYTEMVDDILWSYAISNGEASVGGGSITSTAVSKTTVGAIAIPSVLDNCPVTGISDYAFYNCSGITSITIPTSVKSIGKCAFSGCSGLKDEDGFVIINDILYGYFGDNVDVVIPSGVTSIAAGAFASNYESIVLPASIESIEEYAFSSGGVKTVDVESMDEFSRIYPKCFDNTLLAADWRTNGTPIRFTISFDTNCALVAPASIVCKPYRALEELPILERVGYDFLGWFTDAVEGDQFTDGDIVCNDMKLYAHWQHILRSDGGPYEEDVDGIIWSYWVCNGEAHLYTEGCFIPSFSSSISGNIKIPENLGGRPVTKIGHYAFFYCELITSVEIPSTVVEIGYSAFSYCSSLKSVVIPQSVKRIERDAFAYCSNLENIDIAEGVEEIGGYAFDDCNSLVAINIADGNQKFSSIDGILYNKSGTCLIRCPPGATSVVISDKTTCICDRAFIGCKKISSVIVPNSVQTIGAAAFYNCEALESISIPRSVNSIGKDALKGCVNLKTIYVDYNDRERVVELLADSGMPEGVEIVGRIVIIFDLGLHGCRSGGGELVQIYSDEREIVAPEIEVERGWKFVGWDRDFDNIVAETIITAQYELVEYAITYRNVAGLNNPNPNSYTIEDEIVFLAPSKREGYDFVGWMPEFIERGSIGDKEISALWETTKYTVQFDLGDRGVRVGGGELVQTIEHGGSAIPPEVGVAEGWVFEAWDLSYDKIVSSIVIHAQYRIVEYAIVYEGANDIYNPNPTTYTIEDEIVFTAIDDSEDYYFEGWDPAAIQAGSTGDKVIKAIRKSKCLYDENGDGSVTITGINDPLPEKFSVPSKISGRPVTRIGDNAFSECDQLGELIIPESVTYIGENAFYGCVGLKSVTIPLSVMSVGANAFLETKLLNDHGDGLVIVDNCLVAYKGTCPPEVVIPEGVRLIADGVLSGCNELKSVTIPLSMVSIGNNAFFDCDELKTVYARPGDADRVKGLMTDKGVDVGELEFVERKSDGGPYVQVVDGVTWTYTIKDCEASVGGGTSLSQAVPTSTTGAISIPSTLGGCPVTGIGKYAFYGCDKITSVMIPSSVMNIGYQAFSGCSGITSVVMPMCVLKLSDAFPSAYWKIRDVVLCDGVTSIGDYAFDGCGGLTSVTIPEGVTSIGDCAFWGCSGLEEVHINDIAAWCKISFGNSTANPLYYAHRLYLGDEEVADLIIPESVTGIGNYAFSGCSGLISVTIPSSVTSIGYCAFYGCSGIMIFYVNENNTAYSSRNGLLCSKDGTSLIAGVNSEVDIPEEVTSIADFAFFGCSNLTSMTISANVLSVGYDAFSGCSNLCVTFCGSCPQGYKSSAIHEVKDVIILGDSYPSVDEFIHFRDDFSIYPMSSALIIDDNVTGKSYTQFEGEIFSRNGLPEGVRLAIGSMGSIRFLEPNEYSITWSGSSGWGWIVARVEGAYADGCWHLEVGNPAYLGYACVEPRDEWMFQYWTRGTLSSIDSCRRGDVIAITGEDGDRIGIEDSDGYGLYYEYYLNGCYYLYLPVVDPMYCGGSEYTKLTVKVSQYDFERGKWSSDFEFSAESVGYAYDVIYDRGSHYGGSDSPIIETRVPEGEKYPDPWHEEWMQYFPYYDCEYLWSCYCSSGWDVDTGWRFVGWKDSDGVSYDWITSDCWQATSFTAQYELITNAIYYVEVKGAENPNPTSYTVLDEIVFQPLQDLDEWHFVGWDVDQIKAGTTGDITITAIWKPIEKAAIVGEWSQSQAFEYDGEEHGVDYSARLDVMDWPLNVIKRGTIRAVNVGEYAATAIAKTVGVPETDAVYYRCAEVTNECKWTITPKPVDKLVCTVVSSAMVADGTPKTPMVVVYDAERKVRLGADDYTLVYEDNVNAGFGIARIIGKGNYGSETTVSFEILEMITADNALNQRDSAIFEFAQDSDWVADNVVTHDGYAAMRSGAIGDNEKSVLEAVVHGAGTISFQWKVSSQSFDMLELDRLEFYVDGERRAWINGERDWDEVSFKIDGAGPHTVSWVYAKDGALADGDDCGWVDEVVWDKEWLIGDWLNDVDQTFVVDGDDGGLPWGADEGESADGVGSMRSGACQQNGVSALSTVVRNSGNVSFKWKSSCIEYGDYRLDSLSFVVDGDEVAWINGETDWREVRYRVSGVGNHTLQWIFRKVGETSYGDNCGWVDEFAWNNEPLVFSEDDIEVTTHEGIYDGKAYGISVSVPNLAEAVIRYGASEDAITEAESPRFSDCGEHEIWFSVNAEDFKEYVGSAKVMISKKSIAGAMVVLGDALTYTGDVLAQSVASVSIDGLAVPIFEVRNNEVISSGEHTLTVVGGGNFTGEVDATFTIAKAKPILAQVALMGAVEPNANTVTWVYDGNAHSPEILAGYDSKAIVGYSLSEDGCQFSDSVEFIETTDEPVKVWYEIVSDNYETLYGWIYAIVEPCLIDGATVVLGVQKTDVEGKMEQTVESVVSASGLPVTFEVLDNVAAVEGDFELTIVGTGNFTGSIKWPYCVVRIVKPPTLTPGDGTIFTDVLTVVFSSATEGAVHYFTVDGSTPTAQSRTASRVRVTEKTTIKAISVVDGSLWSAVSEATYALGRCQDPVIKLTGVEGEVFHFPNQEVEIEWENANGMLYYTLDGSEPTESSRIYDGPFAISNDVTVKAKVFSATYFDSATISAHFRKEPLTVATPVINAESEFTGRKANVSMTCATDGAEIRYTLDGSEPTWNSALYRDAISINMSIGDTLVIKAKAFCINYIDSAIAETTTTRIWGAGDALNAPDLKFADGGDARWYMVTDVTHDNAEAMRSGAIDDDERSILSTTVNGEGVISFYWKTDCEDSKGYYDWDHLDFTVDDKVVAQCDGWPDWTQVVVQVSGEGAHTLKWIYVKDFYDSDGEDCAWIDEVVWERKTAGGAVIGDVTELKEVFGAESSVVRNLTSEEELVKFNEFLGKCGITTASQISDRQKQYAYESFRMSAITVEPQLFENEPKLKIHEFKQGEGGWSVSISLKAGGEEIAMARKALEEHISVGNKLTEITSKPDIVASPSEDGSSLTFTIAPPEGKQAFIMVRL